MNTVNKILLKGGKVFFENGFKEVDILLENDKVIDIAKGINEMNYEVVNCYGKIISPGFLDVHVHLRTPGFEYKEDLISGSKSALAGGYTKIYAMPNTKPCIHNKENILNFNEQVKLKALCDVKTYSAISKDLKGEELVDIKGIAKEDIAGFTDDGKGFQDDNKMDIAMKEISKTNKILCVHAEDEKELGEVIGCVNEGSVSKDNNLIGINNASEWKMVKRDLNILKKYNLRYHLCHISTKESLELIKKSKLKGQDVSCEVTPHHLILSDEDIMKNNNGIDTNYKMNPPLRHKDDREALVQGLKSGVIEIIATDHAPHSEKEKAVDICKAPFGIIGLEQAYSVLNTYLVKKEKVSEEVILRALTYNPAKRFLENVEITIGKRTNLIILNPNKKVIYDKSNTYSKSNNNPFMKKELLGKVEVTILDNKIYRWI